MRSKGKLQSHELTEDASREFASVASTAQARQARLVGGIVTYGVLLVLWAKILPPLLHVALVCELLVLGAGVFALRDRVALGCRISQAGWHIRPYYWSTPLLVRWDEIRLVRTEMDGAVVVAGAKRWWLEDHLPGWPRLASLLSMGRSRAVAAAAGWSQSLANSWPCSDWLDRIPEALASPRLRRAHLRKASLVFGLLVVMGILFWWLWLGTDLRRAEPAEVLIAVVVELLLLAVVCYGPYAAPWWLVGQFRVDQTGFVAHHWPGARRVRIPWDAVIAVERNGGKDAVIRTERGYIRVDTSVAGAEDLLQAVDEIAHLSGQWFASPSDPDRSSAE